MLGERHNQARPQEQVASNEDRTRDLALTKRMLCQLSYRGEHQTQKTVTEGKNPIVYATKKVCTGAITAAMLSGRLTLH